MTDIEALRTRRDRLERQIERLEASHRKYIIPNPASERVLEQARATLEDIEARLRDAAAAAEE